ncbi:MAG: DUF4258 domain-containing protein [Bacteroidia bacterium]
MQFTSHAETRMLDRGFSGSDIQKIINEGQRIPFTGPNGTPQIMYKLGDYKVVFETVGRNAGKIVTIEGNYDIIRFSDGLRGIFTGW